MDVHIDLEKIYQSISGPVAKLTDLEKYIDRVLTLAGTGNHIILSGGAPIWLYLKIAHALHGKAKSLAYTAPGQAIEKFVIFNHNPYSE